MPHPKVKIADNSGNEVGVTNNRLDVNIAGGASIDIGDVEVKGHTSMAQSSNIDVSSSSAEQITTLDRPCKHIDIMAAITNTGIIYVGSSGTTSADGIALYAGDVYSIDIENANLVYVIASVNGEDVQWVAYN